MTPIDVLLFDTALVCQYAAPAGDTFLGHARDDLTGRHARDILPPAADGLGPILERAARRAAGWRSSVVTFRDASRAEDVPVVVSVQVEPFEVEAFRGVLVILTDARRHEPLIAAHTEPLQEELAQAHCRLAVYDRTVREIERTLRERLQLPMGYLQALVRRPGMFQGRAIESVIETDVLPRLGDLVVAFHQIVQGAVPHRRGSADADAGRRWARRGRRR